MQPRFNYFRVVWLTLIVAAVVAAILAVSSRREPVYHGIGLREILDNGPSEIKPPNCQTDSTNCEIQNSASAKLLTPLESTINFHP
jgi:hypothetical protein